MQRDRKSFWPLWLAGCIFANISFGMGIYLSQVLILMVWLIWIQKSWKESNASLFWISVGVVSFGAWIMVIAPDWSGRVFPEAAKFGILIFGAMAFKDLLAREDVERLITYLPIFVAILTVIEYFRGTWDYYDPILHRFGLTAFGSPNTTAFVVAICLVLLVFVRRDLSKRIGKLGLIGVAGVLISALIVSQSRGGVLALLAGLWMMSSKRLRTVIVLAGLAFLIFMLASHQAQVGLERANLLLDLRETGGTGRLEIWSHLLEIWSSSLATVLFGVGPGSVDFYLGAAHIESTHSLYVEILYSYGLFGLLAAISLIIALIKSVSSLRADDEARRVKLALLVLVCVAFLFDSYPLTAQISWVTPLVFALIILDFAKTSPLRASESV